MTLEDRLTALADDLYKMYDGKLPVDMGALLNAADAMSSAARTIKAAGLDEVEEQVRSDGEAGTSEP